MLIQATLREEIAVGREVDMFWCGWARLYRVETLHGNFTLEFHMLSCVKTYLWFTTAVLLSILFKRKDEPSSHF